MSKESNSAHHRARRWLSRARRSAPSTGHAQKCEPPTQRRRARRRRCAAAADYVIGPDDVLSIVFWRDKDISAEVAVRPDGKISLPL